MSSQNISIPNYVKFAFGGSAGMIATLFVQPLDLVKNRMQMSGQDGSKKAYKSSFDAIKQITKNEGLFAIYSGLSAGLLRQATYTTTRLGVYTALFEKFSSKDKPPSFVTKAGIGMSAGLIGSFVGTPTEVALIRMTSDGRLPMDKRRNYRNVFHALARIVREEGVLALWRGCLPTMGRAAVVNLAQLASYSQAKQMILETELFNDGIFVHFGASMISGFITTVASMPVDIVKTRIQNMTVVNGVAEYSGAINAFIRITKHEGVLSLWKGFTPYFLRLGPHTVITFVVLEQMNTAYKNVAHRKVVQQQKEKEPR
uniref:Mitochondrial 2-oxoglutarate/malate carrier protein n=1 Tax=Schmidtea mediterranea TaxID=79327 RepID=A0A0H3YJ72_SCHMD|nr:slc25a-18 [Schmidtea mediterranea]